MLPVFQRNWPSGSRPAPDGSGEGGSSRSCEWEGEKTAGPSTALRSGRDDNFVAKPDTVPLYLFQPRHNLSSRPERSAVEGSKTNLDKSAVRVQKCIDRVGNLAVAGLVGRACQVFGGLVNKTHIEKQADVRHTDIDAAHL